MTPQFTVDPRKCYGCGACVLVCPKRLLVLEDGYPKLKEGKEHLCNDCGQCMVYCQGGALIKDRFRCDDLEEIVFRTRDASDNVFQALKQRRSYRNFTGQSVKERDLEKILEAVSFAPSGGNNRLLRFVIIKLETTRKFLDLVIHWFETDCAEDPVYGQRYAKKIDSILDRFYAGEDPILRNAPSVVFSIGSKTAVWGPVESGINLTYFNLAAEALDIGCCFAGYATAAAQRNKDVRELLGISDEEECFCAMCFGYKTIHAERIPRRPDVNCTLL